MGVEGFPVTLLPMLLDSDIEFEYQSHEKVYFWNYTLGKYMIPFIPQAVG